MAPGNASHIAWNVVVVQTVAGSRFVTIPGDTKWLTRADLDRLAETLVTIGHLMSAPTEDE